MDISIIITCFNEKENILDCLESLAGQDYNGGGIEIVVADGGSSDGTQQLVKSYSQKHPAVRLVVEHKKGTAAGRNTGINAAKFKHIAFIDADCEAPQGWLALLAENFLKSKKNDSRLIAVGGTNIPPGKSGLFIKSIGVALDSYIGSFGSVQGRQFKQPRYVTGLSNLNVLYEKQHLVEIGGYDESLASEAEDADMNFRLLSAGHRFLFIPDSYVWHKMRPTAKSWFKNMFRYGKGRARLLKRYPAMWHISFALPLIFILSFLWLLLSPLSNIFLLPLLYFPALLVLSAAQCLKKKSPALLLHVMGVYMIQHFGYAAGELYGLLHPGIQ